MSLPVGTALGRRRRAPRLLVAVPGSEYGGAERYAVRIAQGARSRFEVAAAVRPLEATRRLRRDLADAGIRTLRMAHGRRVRGAIGFTALIELYRPDVVHLTLPWPLSAGELRAACVLTGVPTVAVHQLVPGAEEMRAQKQRWRYYWACSRRERWVAVSGYGRLMLADAFSLDADRIPVIYNAPRRRTNGASLRSAEARPALGLQPEDHVVASVGRLSQEKGHDLLLAAVHELAPRVPRLRVLIAGTGPARAGLEQTVAEQGLERHVRLVGQIDDVDLLLSATDVFAFPSRREGTPFAMLEAMSSGLPVVATRFGGADEIIDSGTNGLLVPLDSAAELAQALAAMLSDPASARAMGARGRATAARFSEEAMITRTLELLDATARGG